MLECGHAGSLKLGTVDLILSAMGARLDTRVLWNGPELDRLLDAGHAAVGVRVKRRLERWGWTVAVEVSYSRYGERGRIDLLAWHPATATLLVVEIKTDLVDVQDLLGSLDAKARIAPHIAADRGWHPGRTVPAIVFAEDRTVRRRLLDLDVLFDRFDVRGRAFVSWLRRPTSNVRGGMWFVAVPHDSRASRRRVRKAAPRLDIRPPGRTSAGGAPRTPRALSVTSPSR